MFVDEYFRYWRANNDASMARQRELIARCAAKCLEGAPAERYASDVRTHLAVWPRQQARGTALAPEEGIRLEFLWRLGPWVFAPILIMALPLWIPDFWIQSIMIAVIFLAIALSVRFASLWNWREKVRHEWSAMPAGGASIEANSERLTVGATALPWADIRLDGAKLEYLWTPRINPKYRVLQLRLATPQGPLVLDVALIRNGREVIDTICGYLA